MWAYDLILKRIDDYGLVPNQKKGATVNHLTGFVNACKDKGLPYQKKGKFLIFKNKEGNKVIGGVSGMVSSFVGSFALQVCSDKTLTNNILKEAGFLVPKQFSFSLDEKENAKHCFLHNGVRVIKPSNGAGGQGITVGMESEKDFEDGWEYACVNVNKNLTGGKILLEEEVYGFDARVIVVNGKYCCAVTRIPAYVVGDGVQKLEHLINKKNEIRKNHPHHKAFMIGMDSLSQVELSRVAGVGEVV